MKRKFWDWVRNEDIDEFGSGRTLRLEGEISDETWFGDEVTPVLFRDELNAGEGPVTIWLNSPGGDVFAAAQIYNMLMDYKGDVTVKIDALAASAASMIAMAGTTTCMSPTGILMIHNPVTLAMGGRDEMKKAIAMLDEVKESILNAYEIKTGLPRDRISKMMDAETWMNAAKAVELGFADRILFTEGMKEDMDEEEESAKEGEKETPEETAEGGEDPEGACTPEEKKKRNVLPSLIFSRAAAMNSLLKKIALTNAADTEEEKKDTTSPRAAANKVPVNQLMRRLELLRN